MPSIPLSPPYIHVLFVLNITLRVELFVIVRVELSLYITLCITDSFNIRRRTLGKRW